VTMRVRAVRTPAPGTMAPRTTTRAPVGTKPGTQARITEPAGPDHPSRPRPSGRGLELPSSRAACEEGVQMVARGWDGLATCSTLRPVARESTERVFRGWLVHGSGRPSVVRSQSGDTLAGIESSRLRRIRRTPRRRSPSFARSPERPSSVVPPGSCRSVELQVARKGAGMAAESTAHAQWHGDLMSGAGTIDRVAAPRSARSM
jgi:hypothetical protein